MDMTSKTMRKMCVLAGIAVLGATASALVPFDTHISIDRALNSPTITIRYTGAHAALVELRVNGDSIGTRSMTAAKDAGETNFNVSLTDLKDGDNQVEVRLFDRTGKLVGTEKTTISTDQSNAGPVFLSAPKVGATVRGPVEITMAFNRDIKNSIVSFFIDNNFKGMRNFPPYTYIWDTSRENNGWHEVEAWDVDESSQTFKTKKTRVFIDNPGGHTNRNGTDAELKASKNAITADVEGVDRPVKANAGTGKPKMSNHAQSVEPKVSGYTTSNPVHAEVSAASGTKPAPIENPIAMSARIIAPNGKHFARVASATTPGTIVVKVHSDATGGSSKLRSNDSGSEVVAANLQFHGASPAIRAANEAAHLMSITRGQRIPNIGAFAIELNSQFVKFDVQPRVDDGVPMTPLRYLLEKDGGKVDWENMTKTVHANAAGKAITIQIGDRNAKVDELTMSMEVTPYLDRGRTIVPLSFIHEALGVNVEYDKETGHDLITSTKK
jgi:hypothetical protein